MKPAWGWPGCVALSSLLTELPGHFHLQAPGCLFPLPGVVAAPATDICLFILVPETKPVQLRLVRYILLFREIVGPHWNKPVTPILAF